MVPATAKQDSLMTLSAFAEAMRSMLAECDRLAKLQTTEESRKVMTRVIAHAITQLCQS
jgi:hypothetical protein